MMSDTPHRKQPSDETELVRDALGDTETAGPPHQSVHNLPRPHAIGPYKILETLGEGGMGVVYLAEQTKPIRRRVALKVIKLGMDTKQVIARFEVERQALALMDHPHVAKVLDAGATEQGRPFFVMEHVAGIPITDYCDKHRLSTKDRLAIFTQVCHAVQHAHQKGIIHRDIKPSNVLVAVQEGKPVPKVIDFGVAKATQQKLTEQTLFTEQGQLIGTPGYMSPEQAEMTALDVDTRTDIYSLGVLLYELLAGAMPFEPSSLRQAAFGEIQRIIREEEPPKPSTRLSSLGDESGAVAKKRRTDQATLARQLRGDLDWITMRAMEKDRTRRYATASELAEDISRHLSHVPVVASPPSAGYRFRKFVRRNKGPVIAGVTVAVVLIAGLVGTSYGLAMAVRARDGEAEQRRLAEQSELMALAARDDAEAVTKFLTSTISAVDPEEQGKDVSLRAVLDAAAPRIKEAFADKPLIRARLHHAVGWTYRGLGLYDQAHAHLAEAAALYYKLKGKRHPATLQVSSALIAVLVSQGNYSTAEAQLIATLETQRHALGEEHTDTLDSSNNLAVLYKKQGRYAEAEQLYLKTIEISERVLGEEHAGTLVSMGNLANLYMKQGRYAEAESLYLKIIETMKRVLGEDHPDALISMNNLAGLYKYQGHYAEAKSLYLKTLDTMKRVLGEEHPITLSSMADLGVLYNMQGRHAEAESLYVNILKTQKRVLGEEHPNTLFSMHSLAATFFHQGKYEEAEKLNRKTLETRRRVLGDEHIDTLMSINNLAILYRDQGRYAEAQPMYLKTLETMKRVLGEEHPNTLMSMNNLANLYYAQGRFAEAEQLDRKTLEARRRVLGDAHPNTLGSIRALEKILRDQGKTEEALPLSRELLAHDLAMARAESADANTINTAAWNLLTIESPELRDPEAALPLAIRANDMTHHENPGYLDTLSLAYHLTGGTAKAIETQRKAIALLPEGESKLRTELETNLGKYEAALTASDEK